MTYIYIFTYRRDQPDALECVRCARKTLPHAVITVVDDGNSPCTEGAETQFLHAGATHYERSQFNRRGNLNGPECVRGILSYLAQKAEDEDIVIKLDSDTCLLSADWIEDMLAQGKSMAGCSSRYTAWKNIYYIHGTCYAMTGKLAKQAFQKSLSWTDWSETAPEDLEIYRLASTIVGEENILKEFPWTPSTPSARWTAWNWMSFTVTPEKYKHFSVVTFGMVMPSFKPRSLRALAMKELRECVFPSDNSM